MDKELKLIVFASSPDSAEIMAGGTLIKYARAGHKIYDVIVNKIGPTYSYGAVYTDSSKDSITTVRDDREMKRREQESAGKLIGYQNVIFLEIEDLEFDPKRKWEIVDIIRETKPDIVLTHFDKDRNPGFSHLSNVVKEASLLAATGRKTDKFSPHRIKRLYMFGIRGWAENFVPDLYIDIGDVIEEKKKALAQYKSMWDLPGRSEQYWLDRHVITQNKQWAFESGIAGYAEAFKTYWTRLFGTPLASDFFPY